MRNVGNVREKIAALLCLTLIALVAMLMMDDPENLLVNIVVAIAAFITGSGIRKDEQRKDQ